jgi:lambda repressor-like predicted transcriptional regulator
VQAFRVKYLLRAVMDAGGDFSAASRATGIHINTLTNVLSEAGYSAQRVKQIVRQRREVHSVGRMVQLAERRRA